MYNKMSKFSLSVSLLYWTIATARLDDSGTQLSDSVDLGFLEAVEFVTSEKLKPLIVVRWIQFRLSQNCEGRDSEAVVY